METVFQKLLNRVSYEAILDTWKYATFVDTLYGNDLTVTCLPCILGSRISEKTDEKLVLQSQ